MWFLLFSLGAVLLGAFGLPAARRLPLAPPPEALVACYFLLATLLRLLVRDARLSAFERKARKEARRKDDTKGGSVIGELGLGVGRGALQAVGGDLLGAGISLASALLRGAASSMSAPPPPQRERRRAVRREQVKAATCVASVGLVCAFVAWEPLLHVRLRRAADAAMTAGLGPPDGKVQAAGMGAAVPRPPAPVPGPAASPVARPVSGEEASAAAEAMAAPAPTQPSTPGATPEATEISTAPAIPTPTSAATPDAASTPAATPAPALPLPTGTGSTSAPAAPQPAAPP